MSGKTFPTAMEELLKRYSFLKAIVITDTEGAEVLKIINTKSEFHKGTIRIDAVEMAYSNVFQTTQDQLSKLEQAGFDSITAFYDGLVIEQRMLGQRILLTLICDSESHISILPLIAQDIKSNIKLLDFLIEKVKKQTT